MSMPRAAITSYNGTSGELIRHLFGNRVNQELATLVVARGFIGDRACLVYLSSTVVPKPAYK